MTKLNKIFSFLIIVFAAAVATGVAFAWSNPPGAPPSGGGALYYSSGNVGIGTTGPIYKLDIVGTGARLTGGGVEMTQGAALWTPGWGGIGTNTNHPFEIRANNVFVASFLTSGNVGIGITNPGYKFDVQGGQINASDGLCIAGDCKTVWPTGGGSGSGLWATSGTAIYNTNTGNVGIGTTNPTYGKLEVVKTGAGTETALALLNSSTGGHNTGLHLGSRDYGSFVANFIDSVNFANSGTKPLYIAPSGGNVVFGAGNVGIGTTNPSTKLQVVGGLNTGLNEALRISGGSAAVGAGPSMGYHAAYGAPASYPTWLLAETGAVFSGGGSGNWGGAFVIRINQGANATDMKEYVRVANTGNVGIGTANPEYPLHVVGSSVLYGSVYIQDGAGVGTYNGNDAKIKFYNATGTQFYSDTAGTIMTVHKGGNVGIGTTNPGANLEVAAVNPIIAINSTVSGVGALQFQDGGAYRTSIFWSRTGNKLYVDDAGLGTIFNGNVGIGTATPGYKLDVQGGSRAQQYRSDSTNIETVSGTYTLGSSGGKLVYGFDEGRGWGYNSADDAIYYQAHGSIPVVFKANGNVGIGTTNPGAKLEVNGDIKVPMTDQWCSYGSSPGNPTCSCPSGYYAINCGTNHYEPKTLYITGAGCYAETLGGFTDSNTAIVVRCAKIHE